MSASQALLSRLAALANPDSLADIVDPPQEYEATIYGVGQTAWRQLGFSHDDYLAALLERGWED